ncbi:alpha-ribazole phosphatase [Thioclava dalianensis]|uniref:threonine-phosphate decarboxylase n=1 Tax=Thioclava dalianensis TaxID=1185766 RepID=A0A074TGG7_9RHOB|nr:threonine-phosphate decarboxylase CobD [Thioclava dalianensis]KEP68153.1 alpha-ribazole phosphatase [Thioclava dalianensis]SFN39627.1 L-threonine O-3-phosphate decarboxylase [Thioclava dalianensis]
MRDHGGNLDMARAQFGGAMETWIDLSTGINRCPYPLPALPASVWTDLPTRAAQDALIEAAGAAFDTQAAIVPLAGAQSAIQMIPRLRPPGTARILSPTYNEHAACLRAAGWQVTEVTERADLEGADLAVLVNPNNPDGRSAEPETLLELARTTGTLVVDESFADPYPALSLAPHAGREGLIVLRSFGKFYGLAGLRLGFALGAPAEIAALREMAGPWPVSGAALEIGSRALGDTAWQRETTARLHRDAARLDARAERAGWQLVGGTALFRLYRTPDALAAQTALARARIWSRIFPWSPDLIRLGLPGAQEEWDRVENALGAIAP